MRGIRAVAYMPESPFRLFHLRAHIVKIVAGRNYREEKNERTTYNASEKKRRSYGLFRPTARAVR
jgi:hypothetical protein